MSSRTLKERVGTIVNCKREKQRQKTDYGYEVGHKYEHKVESTTVLKPKRKIYFKIATNGKTVHSSNLFAKT